jgi:hypothetical protein
MPTGKRIKPIKVTVSDALYQALQASASFHNTTVAERMEQIAREKLFGEMLTYQELVENLNHSDRR